MKKIMARIIRGKATTRITRRQPIPTSRSFQPEFPFGFPARASYASPPPRHNECANWYQLRDARSQVLNRDVKAWKHRAYGGRPTKGAMRHLRQRAKAARLTRQVRKASLSGKTMPAMEIRLRN